jgi:class 3 adenylate cyclase
MAFWTEELRLRPWNWPWISMSRAFSKSPDAAASNTVLPRRSLFKKYFLALFAAVVIPLLANGLSEAWFGYQDQRVMLDTRLRIEASAAAGKIQGFLDGIRDQMAWTVQLAWADNLESHRVDALRLLRQAPAIVEVALIDGAGIERLRISRLDPDVSEAGVDRSSDPAVIGARKARVWYGPVTLHLGSEPFMTIAIAGNRAAAGVMVAQINLKLIWDVISAIDVGKTGLAFVVDGNGHLVAHPNIGLVLQGADDAIEAHLRAMGAATLAGGGEPVTTKDVENRTVLVAMAPMTGVDWKVYAEQPIAEAYAPLSAALWRTGFLIVLGAGFALALAYLLAQKMTGPIRWLREGATLIGAGQFDHKIKISTGDELESLADSFNQMAGELAVSQERSERIARLKRFLSPQVAEIVEHSGDGHLLDARRADVVVIFCDLRGFTEFSAKAEPEEIMRVLGEYYEAVGENIVRHEATLTHFSGDGLMVLLNAPVPCTDSPALRAIRMAQDIQTAVQALIVSWRGRGRIMGFGIGIAEGIATVGRVGYKGRNDYTAIGNVANLASRLCSSAEDGQILLDSIAAASVSGAVALASLGKRSLKGFADPVPVYAMPIVSYSEIGSASSLQLKCPA